ncbi:MAG: hypothetical protein AABX47_01185 [Nanoarchaeota archaeon]
MTRDPYALNRLVSLTLDTTDLLVPTRSEEELPARRVADYYIFVKK